jgi:DNA topoisomerase IA
MKEDIIAAHKQRMIEINERRKQGIHEPKEPKLQELSGPESVKRYLDSLKPRKPKRKKKQRQEAHGATVPITSARAGSFGRREVKGLTRY